MCTQVDSRKFEEVAVVAGNRRVGPGLFELALKADRTAAAIRPGQFVHLLLDAHREHILRRPFSVYRIDDAGNVVVLYQVVGKGSALMGDLRPGDPCSLIARLAHACGRWARPYRMRRSGQRASVHVRAAPRLRGRRVRRGLRCP